MSTSTLRVLIVIAALALGVVVLREAFPTTTRVIDEPRATTSPAPVQTPSPTPSPSPSPSPSPTPTKTPKPKPKPRVAGVVLQVLNGTPTDGLATQVSARLEEAGYTLESPGNAGSVEKTTLYFQPGHKINAEYLKDKQFRGSRVLPAPDQYPEDVDITVVLGRDFNP